MDFFEHQDRARRKSKWLVLHFTLAVILITAAVYLVCVLIFFMPRNETAAGLQWLWHPKVFAYVSFGTLLVIFTGSFAKILELSRGGSAVAKALGGRPINTASNDLDEKKLLNVVEEMAIASGIPVPEIYILDAEQGINAFAAGHSISDAAIGVTRGCMKLLNRDQLQGVIAHEFSHILNSDMRINIRLIGLLNGILCLAIIGRLLLYTRGRKNPLPLLGLALLAIGFIGVFFGRLIKSAVSRQREFLADASAIQFTRNPDGLAGALKTIGGLLQGSRLVAPNAEEASHLFFGNGLAGAWSDLFSTHPPLANRIRAIDPSFDGVFPQVQPAEPPAVRGVEREQARMPPILPFPPVRPDSAIASIGSLSPMHLQRAAQIRTMLPPVALQALAEPAGAVALVYASLLGKDESTRKNQLQLIESQAGQAICAETIKAFGPANAIQGRSKLALIDLALPALRQLSENQYAQFTRLVKELIESDRQVSLFEYTLQRILLRHLQPHFELPRKDTVKYRSIKPVLNECVMLISALAQLGHDKPEKVAAAFRQGARQLDVVGVQVALLDLKDCNLPQIDAALDRLASLAPTSKKNLLFACAHTVAADGLISHTEAELLRAIADSLGCPIPPIVENLESVKKA